jgi:hypothetical protein
VLTVILLSDTARSIYEPARIYFAPFEEAGLIAFCDWNQSPDARGLHQVVPKLPDVIRGHAAWRAVVVDHPRGANGEDRDAENPFDFTDNNSIALNLADSPHALIRLSHVLLGYPHLSTKHFQAYLQYEDAETGRTISGDPRLLLQAALSGAGDVGTDLGVERTEEEWFTLATTVLGQTHNNVRRLFREVEYSTAEQQMHSELVERYRMREVRPSEVLFVATRADVLEDDKAALRRAWRADTEHIPSRFVERNDYPPMSRFATYELLEEQNSGYDQDLLRFWLSVLTVTMNQLPPGSCQADRLYELGVEFEAEGLGEMLNSHLSTLGMVRDHLDRIIRTPNRPPEMSVQDLLAPVETGVAFDDLGGAELMVGTHGYGLVSDRPRYEILRWKDDLGRASTEARTFLRRPRRAIARAEHSTRELATIDEDAVTLNDIEREELDDELARRLRALVVPATSDLLDADRLQRVMENGDRQVTRFLTQRMSARTVILAAVVALGIWVAAFIPYLVQAARRSPETVADAAIVMLLVLAVVAGIGLGVLVLSRSLLRQRIHSFNDAVQQELVSVRSSASRFADFLSGFVTFRRGSARLRGASRQADEQVARLRRLRRLRTVVGEKIAQEKGIIASLGTALVMQRTSRGLVDFDPDDERSVRSLFRFPPGDGVVPFNESGESVRAPYGFVSRLTLRRIAVFEPGWSLSASEGGS